MTPPQKIPQSPKVKSLSQALANCTQTLQPAETMMSHTCRDGSKVQSIGCSSRGPRLGSQHLYGGSEPSVTPGSREVNLQGHGTHMVHRLTCKQNTYAHKNKEVSKNAQQEAEAEMDFQSSGAEPKPQCLQGWLLQSLFFAC